MRMPAANSRLFELELNVPAHIMMREPMSSGLRLLRGTAVQAVVSYFACGSDAMGGVESADEIVEAAHSLTAGGGGVVYSNSCAAHCWKLIGDGISTWFTAGVDAANPIEGRVSLQRAGK